MALSDDNGDTVQTYEYSIYGQVAATDNSHPNPYMFTGRRYDKEIGLYYYRARCYNPYVGRFLQTDPVGYEAGMNLYLYCTNNPLNLIDPFGLDPCDPNDPCSCGNIDMSESDTTEPEDNHYTYTWGGTWIKAKIACGLASIITCPFVTGGVAEAFEGGWCAAMTRPCISWCFSGEVAAAGRSEFCVTKCNEEYKNCHKRAKKGKCIMNFRVQFN